MSDPDYHDNSAEDIYPVAECRACLQILYSDSNLWNIFESWTPSWHGMEKSIAEDLVKLANIQISESDRHSKVICESCYQVLLGACQFTACVRKNDQILVERYPREPQLNSDDRDWPKPIQVDQTIHSSMLQNPIDVEVKQEVLSDDELYTNGTFDEKDNVPNLDIKIEPEEIQQFIQVNVNGSKTDSKYESGAPERSTKKLHTQNVHKKFVTTYAKQDFQPSETQSDNELRRGSSQIIGDIVTEHANKQMEIDDNQNIDHVQKPRQITGVRLNKAPKTSAERGREFRARKSLLKQQSKQQREPDAIVEVATEIRSPSEDKPVRGPFERRAIDKRAKAAEATRRWRERKKGVSGASRKQAKTAAQRMREYRERRKIVKEHAVEAAK